MTRPFRELEHQDQRVLGALALVDASTGAAIDRALELRVLGPGHAVLRRNASGLVVIREWSQLAAHASAFDAPPEAPAIRPSLRVAVRDPLGQYLPRLASITLPRDPSPEQAASADSLFQPLRVPMYPAAGAATGNNWSLLRVSLHASDNGDALGGALLRVRRNGTVLARGLTDARGEGLVAVVGVPVTTFSDDENAVVVSEIEVELDAVFDRAMGLRTPRGVASVATPWVDPLDLEARADTLPRASTSLFIAARRTQPRALVLDLS